MVVILMIAGHNAINVISDELIGNLVENIVDSAFINFSFREVRVTREEN
jgi:hypothetical protein